MNDFFKWFESKPLYFAIAVVGLSACVWSISSCTSTAIKAEYEYKKERDKHFWGRHSSE